MVRFAVIEVDDGLTIVEVLDGQSAEEAALMEGGILVDTELFLNYEDACDALDQLEMEDEDEMSADEMY